MGLGIVMDIEWMNERAIAKRQLKRIGRIGIVTIVGFFIGLGKVAGSLFISASGRPSL